MGFRCGNPRLPLVKCSIELSEEIENEWRHTDESWRIGIKYFLKKLKKVCDILFG
jgi:hypothetical protein